MMKLKKVKEVFDQADEVKLAYLFGSRATGDDGPNSDYDFAVYLSASDASEMLKTKMDLLGKLTKAVKTDAVDLLVLNNSDKPELNYEVITEGKLLKDIEPTRLIVEPKILNEYFDFRAILLRYGLTKPI